MKKNLFGLILMILAFTACEGPEGPMGPQGIPGEPGLVEGWHIVDVTIPQKDWVLTYDQDGLNPYFHCYVDIEELDDYVYDEGLVFAYLVQDPGTKYEVQTSLNCSMPYQDPFDPDYTWTVHYSWDYMFGSVAFYVKYDDFVILEDPNGNIIPPATEKFKIVMLW